MAMDPMIPVIALMGIEPAARLSKDKAVDIETIPLPKRPAP